MTPITVRLPDDLHERLTQIAEDERRSLNSQIVYMLEKSVVDYERQEEEDDGDA